MADLTPEEIAAHGYTPETVATINADRRRKSQETAPGGSEGMGFWGMAGMLILGALGIGGAGLLGANGVFGAGAAAMFQQWINKITEAMGIGTIYDKPIETFLREAVTKPDEFAQLLQHSQFGLGLSEDTAKAVAAEAPKFLDVIAAALKTEGKTLDQAAAAPGAMLASKAVIVGFITSDLSQGLKEKLITEMIHKQSATDRPSPEMIATLTSKEVLGSFINSNMSDAFKEKVIYDLIKKQGTPERPIPESVATTLAKKPHLILNIINDTGLDINKLMTIGTLNMAADDANILLKLVDNPDLLKVAKSIPVADLKTMLGITSADLDVALNVMKTGDNLDKISKVINDLKATGTLDMAKVSATIQAMASGKPLDDASKGMFATLASKHLSLLAPLTSLDMSALPAGKERGMAQASLENMGHVIAFQGKAQLSPEQLKQFAEHLVNLDSIDASKLMQAIPTLQVIASKDPQAWKEMVAKLNLSSYPLPLPESMLKPMLSGAADLPPPQKQGALADPLSTEQRALAAVQGINGVKHDDAGSPLFAQGTGGSANALS